MTDTRGIHWKYDVKRADIRDQRPGDRHYGCDYFVLDLTHDPDALVAATAYAEACMESRPQLSADLLRKVAEHDRWRTDMDAPPKDGAR